VPRGGRRTYILGLAVDIEIEVNALRSKCGWKLATCRRLSFLHPFPARTRGPQ